VLPGVISATRLTLGVVALGLVFVGISMVIPVAISVIFEYCATFSSIIGLAAVRAGIWRAEPEWLGLSSREAARWMAGLTILATCGGLIGLYADDVKNVVNTVVETVFNFFLVIVAVCVCYKLASKTSKGSGDMKAKPQEVKAEASR
jgi:hypothetical protein